MKMRAIWAVGLAGLFFVSGCTQNQPTSPANPTQDATTSASPGATTDPTQEVTTDEVTIYVVRHGRTMLNTTDRVQGWSDAVLTPEGEEVVKAAGRGLKDVVFQSAYSSDSGRAIQTAKLILAENESSSELVLENDQRFREFNFGTWEGDLNHNMWTAAAALSNQTMEEWLADLSPQIFADSVATLDKENPEAAKNWPAEDYATISARLKDGIDDLVDTETAKGNGNVLLVSHGLSISALFDQVVPEFQMPEGGLKNASVSILKYKDGEYTMESINDLSYVEKGTQ